MKKPNKHRQKWLNRKNRKKNHKLIRKSISKKHRKRNYSKKKKHDLYIKKMGNMRYSILKKIHKPYLYRKGSKTITISQPFGLEDQKYSNYFIKKASEMIDFNHRSLILDISRCPRIWPSAVMLLCSLKEWVEFGSKINHVNHPNIASTNSSYIKVNSYLDHCGFYDYVGRNSSPVRNNYSNKNIVKIKREMSRDGFVISQKEDKILDLLANHTSYSKMEIKEFGSVVLLEIFGNVLEHGVSLHDQGWWSLAQFHKKHNMISLNIADNGIGFKESLLSGPQRSQIMKKIPPIAGNEGELIKYAMDENVSGATDASIQEGTFFMKGYRRGSHRGNGLDRILNTCKKLGISFSILSHRGYIFYDNNGKISFKGHNTKRVFAGTFYHFNIPC